MSGKRLTSVELYKLSYDAHYSSNRLDVAYALYNRVIEEFPNSTEARYAAQQIPNITSRNPGITPNVEEANTAIETGVVKRLVSSMSEEEKTYYTHVEDAKSAITSYTPSVWVNGLRILAWVLCATGIIGGIYGAYQSASTLNAWAGQTEFAVGLFFIILIVSFVGTFLLTAVIMVFLDMAADISIAKQSNLDILKTLNKMASSTKEK